MAGPLDTIGKAVRANMLFTVTCECGNTRHYRAIDIGMVVGLGRHPEKRPVRLQEVQEPNAAKCVPSNARPQQPAQGDRVDTVQGRTRGA